MKKGKIKWILLVVLVIAVVYAVTKKHSSSSVPRDTFRMAPNGEPNTIDPNLTDATFEKPIVNSLFQGLIDCSSDGSMIPGVAKSWNISHGGAVYTFYLRKSFWSDGTPVTANDFVYSIRRTLAPKTGGGLASLLYIIKGATEYNSGKSTASALGVKAINDNTLQITLQHPASYFLELAANIVMFPVPKHVVEKWGDNWTKAEHIVSNGAYKLVEWKPKSYLKLTRNDKFYDNQHTSISNIIFYTQEDDAALLDRYRGHEIDWINNLDVTQVGWVKSNMPDQLYVTPYAGTEMLAFNLKGSKFSNPKVREALNMAVDRQFITQKVIKGGQLPAYSFVPPFKDYVPLNPSWSTKSLDWRTAEAKKMLTHAGYTPLHPLKLTISYNTSKEHRAVAVAVQQMWQQLGMVKVELFNQDAGVHYNNLKQGNFDVGRAAWVADYSDPTDFTQLFTTYSVNNWPHMANPKYDSLYQSSLVAKNKASAMGYTYKAVQLLDDTNAVIPLYYYVSINLVAPRVKGWDTNPLDTHNIRFLSLSYDSTK